VAETRTLVGWFEYLDTKGRELTLSEFMAVMLMNTREYARLTLERVADQKDATEHLEGMVGSLDEYMATNEVYQAIAAKRSRPAPALAEAARP
jgi:predicted lactoylglutathione lyase